MSIIPVTSITPVTTLSLTTPQCICPNLNVIVRLNNPVIVHDTGSFIISSDGLSLRTTAAGTYTITLHVTFQGHPEGSITNRTIRQALILGSSATTTNNTLATSTVTAINNQPVTVIVSTTKTFAVAETVSFVVRQNTNRGLLINTILSSLITVHSNTGIF